MGYGQGYANPGISYHDLPQCGGNFSFVIDYGGKNTTACGAANNSVIQRGDVGGFLIRLSREDIAQEEAARLAKEEAARLAKEEAAKKSQAKPTAVQQNPNHKKPADAWCGPVPGP